MRASPRSRVAHTVALHENTIAPTRGKSVSQVALNCLLRRDEHVIPIPGTTNKLHALENADTLSWELRHEEFAAIDQGSSPWKRWRISSRLMGRDIPGRITALSCPACTLVYASLSTLVSLDSPTLSSLPTYPNVMAAPQIL